MSFIYHLKPEPFLGTQLIPLNRMDKQSDLYKHHAAKYIGREDLMLEKIPKLDCLWNDVVQFSALDPQIILSKLQEIHPNIPLSDMSYFKIPIKDILSHHQTALFQRKSVKPRGDFSINDEDIELLTWESYQESTEVPQATIEYWENAKKNGGRVLLFPYIPHVFVNGIVETKQFEICHIKFRK